MSIERQARRNQERRQARPVVPAKDLLEMDDIDFAAKYARNVVLVADPAVPRGSDPVEGTDGLHLHPDNLEEWRQLAEAEGYTVHTPNLRCYR